MHETPINVGLLAKIKVSNSIDVDALAIPGFCADT
jgi:hypothetical protein